MTSRTLKSPNLKSEEDLREGLHPYQIGGHDHGRGVVGAVVVRGGFTWRGQQKIDTLCRHDDQQLAVRDGTFGSGPLKRELGLEGLTGGVLPVLVPLLVLRQPVVGLSAHRLGEVTERLGVVQVQLLVQGKNGLIRILYNKIIIYINKYENNNNNNNIFIYENTVYIKINYIYTYINKYIYMYIYIHIYENTGCLL